MRCAYWAGAFARGETDGGWRAVGGALAEDRQWHPERGSR